MNSVKVEVNAQYIADQSDPESKQYVYAYSIRIINQGDNAAQLLSRHWLVIDADNRQQEVQGLGVVGEQPVIAAGESYSYTSGVVLRTRTGMMSGAYTMKGADGTEFQADIPRFALVPPDALH